VEALAGSAAATRPDVRIYEQLKADIMEGTLLPNERLVEAEIIARLGTTRGYLRTAFARLEQEGLIVRQPNFGARVRVFTQSEAIQILELRAVIEGFVADRAAQRRTPEGVAQLKKIIADMESVLAAGDLFAYSKLNSVLHKAIFAIADQPLAEREVEALQVQAVRYQIRSLLNPGRPSRSLPEHVAIVEAIAAGDGPAADRAMRVHVTNVLAELLKAMERGYPPR
jgi:DNA-binding GntR family transcriptional regulator